MTEQELKAIEKRWAKATPGPWKWVDRCVRPDDKYKTMALCSFDLRANNAIPWENDAEFIANAPTDIHALLAEVKRLNRMVDLSCKILGDVPGICLDENGMRKFLESEVAE